MTIIKTMVASSNTPGRYSVHWRVDDAMTQRMSISLPPAMKDAAIVSELAALHHLLTVKEVAGNNRNGKSLTIHCQHGAIKKLSLGKSFKKNLIPYAQFLRSRFVGARIVVKKDFAETHYEDLHSIEHITLEGPLEDIVETDQLGCVNIRHHVVQRYMERSGAATLDRAWRRLNRILLSNELVQMIETNSQKTSALLKHGTISQLWKYKNWGLRLVVDRKCLRLVTVFAIQQH